MRLHPFLATVMLAVLTPCLPGLAQEPVVKRAGDLKITPYTLKAGSMTTEAELGKLTVPELHAKPAGNLIELAFVRLKSTSANPGTPIIYLEGGPGSSPISVAHYPEYYQLFDKLREAGDVILLDQRGVGLSRPQLVWAASDMLPLDVFASRENFYRLLEERSRKAAEFWRQRGANLAAYNTEESADDVDDVRRALGVEKVRLLGFSYGTHLGLVTLRRHGKHVESAVLVGSVGSNHMRKLPSTYTKQIAKLSALIAADPKVGKEVPDFAGLMKRVLDRLEKEPAKVQITDRRTNKPMEVTVGKFGVQWITFMDIGDGNDIPIFPALYATMDRGDYSVLAPYVEKRFYQLSPGLSAMMVLMRLASGATAERDKRILREAPDALLGNVANFPFPEVGPAWGGPDLGDRFRELIRSDVRTLFISGSLDSNAPSEQTEEIRAGLPRSTHIVVENAGHEDMLGNAVVQRAMLDFFTGKDVANARISLPTPKFYAIPPANAP
jgi:pimeloyl-ACP methyl ester carboxylesterase